MKDWVSEWVQEGRLFVWRYDQPKRGWDGWHFTADPVGCRSIRNLLDRMHGGVACHRTLNLGHVTEAILSVPNYRNNCSGQYSKLRVEYVPDAADLTLVVDGENLLMTLGVSRLRKLSSAFAEVETGGGDFGIATSDDRKSESWMFWWMPDINYHVGKRL